MNNWIKKIGIDKFAHFGIGGLICAIFTFVFMLQDLDLVATLPAWRIMLLPTIGTIVTVIVSVIKELLFDLTADWNDLWAALIGCGFVYVSVAIGMLFNCLS